jgi:hypothetical protein
VSFEFWARASLRDVGEEREGISPVLTRLFLRSTRGAHLVAPRMPMEIGCAERQAVDPIREPVRNPASTHCNTSARRCWLDAQSSSASREPSLHSQTHGHPVLQLPPTSTHFPLHGLIIFEHLQNFAPRATARASRRAQGHDPHRMPHEVSRAKRIRGTVPDTFLTKPWTAAIIRARIHDRSTLANNYFVCFFSSSISLRS